MQDRSSIHRAFVVLLLAWLLRTMVPVAPRVDWTTSAMGRGAASMLAGTGELSSAGHSGETFVDATPTESFACVDHDCCCRTREQCHVACCCVDDAPRHAIGESGRPGAISARSMMDELGRRVRIASLEVRPARERSSVLTPLSCGGGLPGEMSVPGNTCVALLPVSPRVSAIVPSIVPWRGERDLLYAADGPTPLVPPPRVAALV